MTIGRVAGAWLPFILLLSTSAIGTAAFGQADGTEAHLSIENPAELSKEDARRLYADLKRQLDEGYANARLETVRRYQTWEIYNDAPYVSATHGQRYVNNYANRIARGYSTLGEGEFLPPGSVLAKDSMTVTEDGDTFPGALFIMEKLGAGESPETADWRYIMVIPDGSLFGDTMGDRPGRVAYCHACHERVADRDYTFFVPETYRIAE